ncbi:symmetrical bis(5'-nucleosyl)-tetraphosphatase [Acidithiobacillus montserratensis]|uniref:Symmetrical bis(5'-nucleosyl)-tetraphosphatase n=1 Tax=Acidithiobacillus montserratensis TaxID=2729135 RepID=A0ACD5HF55_9PROT|nr:symmetrical bis(5'-nucleosyl)-tetraphosphatase [Acidithiobacillus montserratensis]MBN2679687.1 symmetrical bis(5'-nucleosyl)-tetraphosphatase [Acidithiobacillaceae bacterium]MBU2748645.1 symmetrical bis(5'-nucleosyl)-tetraphosphatase [Acidithiobacillus montserratensis]
MAAIYALGDLQGCCAPFNDLLKKIHFDAKEDHLWLAGDLLNRGPDSRPLLKRLFHWQDHLQIVLGNHDLYALSRWAGIAPAKKSDTLGSLLSDKNAGDWLDWLRQMPLLHHDSSLGWTMVHAAIHPDWDIATATAHAQELQNALSGRQWKHFLKMLWAAPAPNRWEDCRNEDDAQRFRVAVFTRARYVTAEGQFNWPSSLPKEGASAYAPWHTWFFERQNEGAIICGHWATQGLLVHERLLALDSGCVWGRQLSAARIDLETPEIHQISCPMYAQPSAKE